jgi:hypothetical protein
MEGTVKKTMIQPLLLILAAIHPPPTMAMIWMTPKGMLNKIAWKLV